MKMELLDDAVALPPLRRLLSLLPGDDSAAEREASALSLVVNLQQLPPQSVRQALQSLVHMENYSQSLQRYPLVKQAFWEQVLASDLMVGGPTTRRQELRLQSERFPRLVLDFSRKKLTTELLEVLAEFFACLKSQETSIQAPFSGVNAPRAVSTMRFVPLAVKFVRCRLTADTIELLLPLLRPTPRDSTVVEVGGKVQYCVTSLDLSENGMSSAELMALAELLTKCRWMRDRRRCGDQAPILEELVLEKIVGRSLTTESWAAFRAFVCAAFGITPTLVGLQYSSIGNKMPLKRLSLANNSLNRHHLACICSALRYEATSIEDLSLAHSFSLIDSDDRERCWQWLAVGLRPMSRRLGHSGLRRLDLSGNPLSPRDSKLWLECLHHSDRTIVCWAQEWVESVEPQALSMQGNHCFLSANVELYPSPDQACPRLFSIENMVKKFVGQEATKYEVLGCLRSNVASPTQPAWVCIVIPGFGGGWTQANHVTFQQRPEMIDTHVFAVTSELVMNGMTASLTTVEALKHFVGGFKLRSLELRHNVLPALDVVMAGGEQLQRLDIEGCRVLNIQLLVDALCGGLGQHLRTLNINGNLIGFDAVSILATALRGEARDCIPVLEELRLSNNAIGVNGVQHLHALLEVNKNLQVLALDLPSESATVAGDAPTADNDFVQLYRTRCMRLDVRFQNELLGISPLPLDHKLAFLLVLYSQEVVLDRGICSSIFSFAADERRRRIIWNSTHR